MTVAVEIAIKFDIFCNLDYQDIRYLYICREMSCSLTLIKKNRLVIMGSSSLYNGLNIRNFYDGPLFITSPTDR